MTTTGGRFHFRSECEHGVVIDQCKCADPNKKVTIVPCPESGKPGYARHQREIKNRDGNAKPIPANLIDLAGPP